VFARCNQRLAMVFRSELTRRFDGLITDGGPCIAQFDAICFGEAQSNLRIGKLSQRFLKSLFGEETFFQSRGQSGYYDLTEARKDYGIHNRQLLLHWQPIGNQYVLQGLALPVLHRFEGCLRVQLEKKR
jgi:hypothetical protein